MTKNLFISYRRSDANWAALAIRNALNERLDVNIFMDIETIGDGEDFVDVINESVDQCDALIAVIGPGWLTAQNKHDGTRRLDDPDDFVRLEIARALENGIRAVQVFIEDTPALVKVQLPKPLQALARRQGRRFRFESNATDADGLAQGMMDKGFNKRVGDAPILPELSNRPDEHAPDPRKLYFEGRETFERGDYRKAEHEFAEAASRSLMTNGYADLLTLRAQRWMSGAISFQGRLGEAASILSIISPILREAHGEENPDWTCRGLKPLL